MSIRIYALAKQLKKESKELVEICKKLGLDGKGSPLASLTDEEIEKVSAYVAKSRTRASVSQQLLKEDDSAPMVAPPAPSAPASGKIPVLRPARPSRLAELSRSTAAAKAETIATSPAKPVETPAEPVASPASVVASEIPASPVVAEMKEKPVEPAEPVEPKPVEAASNAESLASQVAEPESESKPEPVEPVPAASSEEPKAEPQEVREAPAPTETKPVEPVVVKADKPEVAEPAPVEAAEEKKPEFPEPVVESKATSESESAPRETSATETTVVEAPKSAPVDVKPEVQAPEKSEKPVVETKPEPRDAASTVSRSRSAQSNDRKSPLRDALDRRDSQRRGRDRNSDSARDGFRRGDRGNDARFAKPVPPTPPYLTRPESREEVLAEMKRPPMITQPHDDRVRVLGQPQRKPKTDASTGAAKPAATAKPVVVRPGVGFHLAPMPAQPAKPVKKAANEPAPQKPEFRLPPEALRAAARGASGPLTAHIREQERRRQDSLNGKVGEKDARRAPGSAFGKDDSRGASAGRDDRKPRFGQPTGAGSAFGSKSTGGYGDSSSDFGNANGKRSKKSGGKDRADEGREDPRTATKRRGANEMKRGLRGGDDDFGSEYRYSSRSSRGRKDKSASSAVTAPRKGEIAIETPCTVKQFAETTGISVAVVIKKLMENGLMLTLNHSLDVETVELLILAFDLKATVKKEATLEEKYVEAAFDQPDPPESLKPRAPVVTFLGHVDHGKTSLLDRILHLHVVSGEKGGITQHIRAYRVETKGGAVTFVDTPGHEAFTEMRARGANCTDVAVLVVAADDGVMPQTEEAISHAKAAGVPIVVALNKMDLPGVNRDKIIQELASNDLMPSEWGGDVEIVETSAVTGMGVDELLETLLTVAELHELKANPDRAATGVVLESSLQSGEGVVCKALVQNGTLRNGDVVLCGSAYGRVRAMTDTLDAHKKIKEAGPSVPVSLVGLDVAPAAGSKFVVLDDISVARQIAEERAKAAREEELADVRAHMTLESLFERMNAANAVQTLNVIIRADVRGSIEAIRKELGKLEHPEVKVKILQATVGGVTEADVHLADASDAIIVGFNVVPDEGARVLAEKKKVQIRRYDVIYKLTDDIRAALEGMLKPEQQVKELGRALVQRAFNISRVGTIAGCRVLFGTVERDCRVRVIRDSRIIGEYDLDTLKREKDDVKEVREGYECGMKLKNFNDVKEGDILETYKIEEVARTF